MRAEIAATKCSSSVLRSKEEIAQAFFVVPDGTKQKVGREKNNEEERKTQRK
jgi:hypothetical protein